MTDWDVALRQLRREYVRDAPARFDRIAEIIDRLRHNPADANALSQLHREFHNLAGSGATYGFPEVSRLGARAEEECAAEVRGGGPSPGDVERWNAVAETLREHVLVADTNTRHRLPAVADRDRSEASVNILVVDDDDSMCSFLEALLTREHASVRTASTCAQARGSLTADLPDGILIDVSLPDGSGYELVDHVRGLPGGDAVAVIMVSRLTGLLDKVEAIRCGADAFFEKPLDEAALVTRLRHLLRRASTEPPRILSVEDDPAYAAYLRALMASAGYEIQICADPRQFEQDLATFKPDLVLMDIQLPDVTGYDLVRFLRQHDAYATLPVLFLTTQPEIQARLETVAAGGDDCLLKSDPATLVLATVAARLERARLLKSLVERDGLTRLLTHAAFMARANAVVAQHRRGPERSAALAMLDVDHFKAVNDRYGHAAGDRVLSTLAALLLRRFRQSDIVGRYGGEEFAVVVQDIDGPDAVRLASRILEEFSAIPHDEPGGTTFRATFSAGVAGLNTTRMDARRWIAEADAALYAAKAAGRNRVLAAAP